MASLDSLIVIATALAMAMSPLALGAWLTTREMARAAREAPGPARMEQAAPAE
jgi:hypothetical protein